MTRSRWFSRDSAAEPRTWTPRFDAAANGIVRDTSVLASLLIGFMAGAAVLGGIARPGPWVYVLWTSAAIAVGCAVAWALTPALFTGATSVAFVFVADIVIALGLTSVKFPLMALVGCQLYVIVATYSCLYLTPLPFTAHIVFTSAFVIEMALLNPTGVMTVMAAALSLWNVTAVPLVVRSLWSVTRGDAERAYRDPLTGLLNRAGLQREFGEMILVARRQTMHIAIVVIDLDRFKPVNDVFGHLVGDAVLVETAQHLQHNFAKSAAVARTGGEEFAIAMCGRSFALAESIDRLPTITAGSRGPRVSMSVGAVLCDLTAYGSDALTTALAAADRAMYSAKQSGGNRCVNLVESET